MEPSHPEAVPFTLLPLVTSLLPLHPTQQTNNPLFLLLLFAFFFCFFFVPAFLFFSSVPFPFLLRVMQFEQLANMSISSGEADVQAPVFSLDRWSCEDLTSWLQQVRGGSALLGVCVVFCVVLCCALRCVVVCCVVCLSS